MHASENVEYVRGVYTNKYEVNYLNSYHQRMDPDYGMIWVWWTIYKGEINSSFKTDANMMNIPK